MKLYTTGQIAKMCHVAPHTVGKWIDSGILKGFRIPGSTARRVSHDVLEAFGAAHDMPIDWPRVVEPAST